MFCLSASFEFELQSQVKAKRAFLMALRDVLRSVLLRVPELRVAEGLLCLLFLFFFC